MVHFTRGGPFTVTLVARNSDNFDTEIKTGYIWAGTPGLWYGETSTDWAVETNWDDWRVPTAGTWWVDVVIPNAAPFWPIYTYGNLVVGTGGRCKTITVSPTGQLTVDPGQLIINP